MKSGKNISKVPYLIAFFICLIIISRLVWPNINYDDISFYLTLLIVVLLVFPNIGEILSRIRKFKKGDLEVEIESSLNNLTEKTEKAEEEIEKSEISEYEFESKSDEINKRILEYTKDPRGGLIAIAVEIESMIYELVKYYKLSINAKHMSPIRAIDILVKKGFVPSKLNSLIRDFWVIRNQVVHHSEFQFTNQRLYRLLDLGIRILDLLSYRKSKDLKKKDI